uniref:CSON009437 protein n=1 Tax=Culicoides sonorensis TaxID=179676 RepID=A0A336KFT7_CULSO
MSNNNNLLGNPHQSHYDMNDQTFHTPSFGDEEFDIPQFNHHLTSHTLDQNQYQMNQHLDPGHQQQQQQQQSQQPPPQYVHQTGPPQWHDIHHSNAGSYGMHQQSPQHTMPTYMQMGNPPVQQQQQQNNHYHPQQQQQAVPQQMPQHMSPQGNRNNQTPPTYHTLGQSPHAHNNMAAQQAAQQQQPPNPQIHQQQQSNVIVENGLGSEDSDDAIPATTLKRPSPDHYSDGGLHHQQTSAQYSNNGVGSAPMDNNKLNTNAAKKQKVPKKKKKKDPNEPQKPVSAYALFFRDTQAAIKGQNPNASFGEVSKIVASMWDVLDTDSKNVYKKRTEAAKKEYLKALAAYRANAVSKESSEGSPSQDSVYSPPHTQTASNPQMQSPPQQQQQLSPPTDQVHHQVQSGMSPPMQNNYGQNMYQQQPYRSPQQQMVQQMHPHYNSPPSQQFEHQPPPAMNHHQMSPPQQQQQQPQQPQQMHPQQPNHFQGHPQQMPGQMGGQPQAQSPSSHAPNQTPQQNIMEPGGQMTCIRHGCRNPAIVNSDWEDEYCSNECVITHCRDVFGNWVQTNQQPPQGYSAVK